MGRCLWFSAVLAWLPMAAAAQYVTVDFVQVPINEALAELERQTGARIYHRFGDEGTAQPLIDVQAQEAPLRAVLRAICQQVDCYFPPEYQYFELKPRPDPLETCPTTQAGPYTVRVRSMNIAHSWALEFERAAEEAVVTAHQMLIELQVEADDGKDLEALAAFHPGVRAVANTGETVAPKQTELPPRAHLVLDRSYVRQGLIRRQIKLDAPSAQAASLPTLEGDLVVRKDAQVRRLEFPLGGGRQQQSQAGHTFTVTSIEPVGETGYQIQGEWDLPPDPGSGVGLPGRLPFREAYLLTADGGRLNPYTRNQKVGRGPDGEGSILRCQWEFRPSREQVPEKFVFAFVTTSVETDMVHYKFEDIPLPTWQE